MSPGLPVRADRDSTRVVVLSAAVRGRARLRVQGLRRQPALALCLRDRLGGDDRIKEVWASPITGNVLVHFDAGRLGLAELRQHLAHEAARYRPREEKSAAHSRIPELPAGGDGTTWHTRSAGEVIEALNDNPSLGLAPNEAERRLQASGPNRLPTPKPKSAFEIIREQIGSLPVLLLGGAAVASIATGGLIDGAAILAVIAINAAIGYATESRVERILASLNEVGVPMAFVRRNGRELLLPRADVVPGDVMLLRPGHDVPADGRLIGVGGLQTDESTLTGEAVPVIKTLEPVGQLDAPIADRTNMVYAGTVVAEGRGEAIVTATGRRTELGRIRALISEASAPRTPLERQLDQTGRQLALASLGLCGGLFVVGVLRGLPALGVFRTAASLAVAAVPEGLPTVATTTLALGMRRMFERRTLIRKLAAVESLGSTTVICVDKTGTVTENRMTVGRWHVAGRDYAQDELTPATVDPPLGQALAIAALCNEATLVIDGRGVIEVTGSATETALLMAGHSAGFEVSTLRARHPLMTMSPRGDGRNWMGSLHGGHPRRLVVVKGAPEEVLRGSTRWRTVDGESELDPAARRQILSANDRMADEGMRVLGLGFKTLDDDAPPSWDDLTWIGLVGLIDPIRAGVRDAIAVCHQAGIRPVMITGDQGLTAVAVGRTLGLLRNGQVRVLEAGQLAHLNADALRGVVREVDVFARVAPAQKYEIVRALQAGGDVVAMTGDGVNDGPALKAADIGVAMGQRGTEMARDVADVILMDDEFGSMVAAVEQGRTLRANLQKALRFLLATNLAEVLVTFGAMLVGRAQPLSALHLLWINLVSDVVPALALGMEPAEPGVMRAAPPVPGAPLLSRDALITTGIDASVMAAATLGAFGVALSRGATPLHASTVAFSTISTAQLLYAVACRSETHSGLQGLGKNRALVAGVGGMLGLQAATLVPPLRGILRTTPLGVADLVLIGASAAAPLLVREALKTIRSEVPPQGGTHG
jgi:Ca2+-transporting ATPase